MYHNISKNRPTELEKIQSLNNGFAYELTVVINVVDLYNNFTFYDKTEALMVANMFIDVIAVHARVLLEFFRDGKSQDDDDVRANDFMKVGETWTAPDIDNDAKYTHLKQVKERINKEVTHLTYDRVRHTKSSWKFTPILVELFDITHSFISKCDEKYIEKPLLNTINYGET